MLIIPVDYADDASGVFDVAYDHSSPIECKWGVYGGKQCIMITADDYAYIPIRISFREDNSGTVSFTVTDRICPLRKLLLYTPMARTIRIRHGGIRISAP